MPPPRSFRKSVWPGDLFSADDLTRVAQDAGITLAETCDFSIAAADLNRAMQQFCTLSQGVDPAGEIAKFFERIAQRTDDLLSEITETDETNPLNQAASAFLRFPSAWSGSAFDPADLDDLVARLTAMKAAAQNALNESKPQPGKKASVATPALTAGLNSAYNIVSGTNRGGYSNPADGSRAALAGPFLKFAQNVLNQAADRLDRIASRPCQDAAAELRKIAKRPNSLTGFRRPKA